MNNTQYSCFFKEKKKNCGRDTKAKTLYTNCCDDNVVKNGEREKKMQLSNLEQMTMI